MSGPAISCEIFFELDAGLAARRRSLAQHLQNRALLFRAIFRAVLDLQIELNFGRAHTPSKIKESPSSRVRIGVLISAQIFPVSREPSLARRAQPGLAAMARWITRHS